VAWHVDDLKKKRKKEELSIQLLITHSKISDTSPSDISFFISVASRHAAI
ncbi:MAG: hypothetical protein ACI8RD_012251, partial [Bacillariaceae sp.]|jgi:hypothetical protein